MSYSWTQHSASKGRNSYLCDICNIYAKLWSWEGYPPHTNSYLFEFCRPHVIKSRFLIHIEFPRFISRVMIKDIIYLWRFSECQMRLPHINIIDILVLGGTNYGNAFLKAFQLLSHSKQIDPVSGFFFFDRNG